MRKLSTLVLIIGIVLISLSVFPTAVSAQNETVRGEPDYDIYVPQNTVLPGQQTTVDVQIRNTGEIEQEGLDRFESQVTTAESAVVSFDTSDDLTIRTGRSAVRDIPRGETVTVPLTVNIPQDADRFNQIDVDISYDHTDEIEYNTTTEEIIDRSRISTTDTNQISIETVDQARFTGEKVDTDVSIGETGIATFSVRNVGDEDVTDATLQLQSTSQNVLFGSSQSTSVDIGELDEDESAEFDSTVRFDTAASQTSYSINAVMEYNNEEGQNRQAEVDGFSIRPNGRVDISVNSVETNASIGASGVTEIEVENDAGKDLSGATIQLSSESGAVLFEGRSPQTTVSLGNWDSDETRSFGITTIITDDAARTGYSVTGQVTYDNADDISNVVTPPSFEIRPRAEQDVSVDVDGSELREGERGSFNISIQNNGPMEIRDVGVSLQNSGDMDLLATQFNVDDLDAEGSQSITVPTEVPENINSLTQAVDITTEYEYGRDNSGTESTGVNLDVSENRNRFDLTVVDSDVRAGSSRTVEVQVTNTLGSEVRNLDTAFSTSDPLSVSQDSAFITSLSPNQSKTINVPISVSSNAALNTYPLEVDFQYEGSDGIERLSKVYSVPIDVQEPAENSNNGMILLIAGVFGLIVVSLVIYYRKRIQEKSPL